MPYLIPRINGWFQEQNDIQLDIASTNPTPTLIDSQLSFHISRSPSVKMDYHITSGSRTRVGTLYMSYNGEGITAEVQDVNLEHTGYPIDLVFSSAVNGTNYELRVNHQTSSTAFTIHFYNIRKNNLVDVT